IRSSGRATVSRTSVRIDSVRRSRRGRRSGEIASSVGGVIAFVVLAVSVDERARASGRAEPRPGGPVRAVRAEVLAAGDAPVEQRVLLRIAATDAVPPLDVGHSTLRAAEIFRAARR